jgi:16S rRNA (cytidine1402-2'-O)-methyltransferase
VPGRLVICATPIGNLDDAAPRLAATLAEVDVVYAEDTRRSGILLSLLGVSRPIRSFFAGNEAARAAELASRLQSDESVALLTDAGTPAISDPGLSAVQAARRCGAVVTVIPGPSAVTAALSVSGLPSDRFVFEGFLPRKGHDRAQRLDDIAAEARTTVVFAAPARLAADLADLEKALGEDRSVTVCRELSKLHEEIWFGSLGAALTRWRDEIEPKGEFTIVIAGRAPQAIAPDRALPEVHTEIASGASLADAVRSVASRHGISRRELYELAIRDRDGA